MTKILFVRSQKAFLPEVDAYMKYFTDTEEFKAYDSSKLEDGYQLEDFDVIWEFKGLGGLKVKERFLVHEYASLSTGVLPKFKNLLKSQINIKPSLRIFLNENVRCGFYFNDEVKYCYRDMGIDERFLQVKDSKKEYEFVYVGSISKEREIDKFLKEFVKKTNGKICLIGNIDNDIYINYKSYKDIIFTGRIPYPQIPEIASKAIYGINFVPDKYPYNIQTSTKLLEYLALGLKVVSTDYKWSREFEKIHDSSFYKLDYNNLKFDIKNINQFKFVSNFNAKDFLWSKVIEKSGIKEILNQIIF